MSLKIWFFPVMMLVSIVVFFAVAYPGIMDAKDAYDQSKVAQSSLALLNSKKENIRELDQSIGANKDLRDILSRYFPNRKSEERIIGTVSGLAAGNMLVLTDISISSDSVLETIEDSSSQDLPRNPFNAGIVPAPVPQAQGTGLAKKIADMPDIKKTSLEILVVGKYDNIKSFVSSLSRANMVNDINAITIKISNSEDQDQGQGQNQEQDQGQEQVDVPTQGGDPSLEAMIDMDFYSIREIRSANYLMEDIFNSTEQEKKKIDFSKIKLISEYANSRVISVGVGEKGKANPFK